MPKQRFDNEILVNHAPVPGIVARGDMHKAVVTLYHRYKQHDKAQHLGPAVDAALRLIRLAPTELIQAARIVEDEPDLAGALERLLGEIPRPNLDDPALDVAAEFAERELAAYRKSRPKD